MTWTYGGDPSASPRDEVRFLIQDTNEGRQLIDDEGIDFWLTRLMPVYEDTLAVAAQCCDTIAGRFASEVSQSGDGVSISLDQLQDKYTTLAASLRSQYERLSGVEAVPYVGAQDPYVGHLERPGWAAIGQHDNPDAGSQDTSDSQWAFYPDPGTS